MDNIDGKLKLTLLLVSSLTIMSVITISPSLPQMAEVFSSIPQSDLLVQLTVTIPALTIALFAPITGNLIDRYGRLKILWFALILYAISGVSGYFLDNLFYILFSRALLGISVGMSMTIIVTLIADYFQGNERQKFVGQQVAFMSLGGILFITIGGLLADAGWRFPFLIYLLSLIVLPFSVFYLREPIVSDRKSDGLNKTRAPRFIWFLFVNTMIMWIVFFLIPLQIPFHLKSLGVESNALAGAAIAVSTAFSAVASVSYHKLKERFNFIRVFSFGYLLMAAGFFLLSFSESYLMVVFSMVLAGAGIGMMIPNTNMWVMKLAPPEIRGKEIGKLTTFWFFGQFVSPLILAPLLTSVPRADVFMLAAGLLLLMALGFLIFQFSKSGRVALQ